MKNRESFGTTRRGKACPKRSVRLVLFYVTLLADIEKKMGRVK